MFGFPPVVTAAGGSVAAVADDHPRRIAVLGAGGFLGSHLVPELLRRHQGIIEAVDLRFDKLTVDSPRLLRTCASIADRALLTDLVARSELVISLTALCNPALYNTQPLEVIDASYSDLAPLCDLCAKTGTRLVHFSTCEVYGRMTLGADGVAGGVMHEDESALVLGPVHRERWTYACAKQLLERRIWALGKHHGLRFTIIRPFNVIGARMDYLPGIDGEGLPRVLASFMDALLRNRPLLLAGGGLQRRSFVAVEDFTEAVVRVTERLPACEGEILNLGNPSNDISIAQLAAMLVEVYVGRVPSAALPTVESVDPEVLFGPGYDDVERRVPDISRAERLLGWRPTITMAEMLPGIVEDYIRRYAGALSSA